MSRKARVVSTACALALGLATTTAAQAAKTEIEVLAKPGASLERTIDAHRAVARYRALAAKGARLAAKAKRIARRPAYELAGGVSQSTLDAIAACESGGDPTAVDSSGTYQGKYQFDAGTWASVGGSGSPAEASEAEQDYRASLLYSRAGSSPWPVCG